MGGERTLRSLSSITHVVMDKTGTLTDGRLRVIACDLRSGIDQMVCNRLLYLAERDSAQSHPAGKAVFQWALQQLESAEKRKFGSASVTDCQSIPGKGVSCVISHPNGRRYLVHIGSLSFLQESDVQCADSEQFHRSANSVLVHFAFNRSYAGHLLLQVCFYAFRWYDKSVANNSNRIRSERKHQQLFADLKLMVWW
jgi:P-type Cu+ transporter